MTAVLHSPVFALGSEKRTLVQTSECGGLYSASQSLSDSGFINHSICSETQSAYDLAKAAVQQIPQDSLRKTNIIIYATCLPCNGNLGSFDAYQQTGDVKHLMDFPASHLQADFGLENVHVIGLNQQACTGILGAIRLAQALIHTEPDINQVLCLTADRFPSGARYEQAFNLISDGAAACLVSTEELLESGYIIEACHGLTNGALAKASDDETVGTFFNYTHRSIEETLAKANLTMSDIQWVVAQNTNITAWKILARLLDFDIDQVSFPSMPEVGHMISGDNLVNLNYLEQEKRIQSGDRLLLTMAGFGLNWQCLVLRKR